MVETDEVELPRAVGIYVCMRVPCMFATVRACACTSIASLGTRTLGCVRKLVPKLCCVGRLFMARLYYTTDIQTRGRDTSPTAAAAANC